uniref:hypothetical protein n=1 Tax=uncultured Rhizobium sp. TaxID=155567 RepID=UPI002622B04F|nr:hypothetical protein [uncultured Rhizobium sp.]
MREIHRPVHSGYETLRRRRDPANREAQFNRRSFPAYEQLTALGFAARLRPQDMLGQPTSK